MEPAPDGKPSRGGCLPQCHQGILRALTEREPIHGGLSFKAFSSLPKVTVLVPDMTPSMKRQGYAPPNPYGPRPNIKEWLRKAHPSKGADRLDPRVSSSPQPYISGGVHSALIKEELDKMPHLFEFLVAYHHDPIMVDVFVPFH